MGTCVLSLDITTVSSQCEACNVGFHGVRSGLARVGAKKVAATAHRAPEKRGPGRWRNRKRLSNHRHLCFYIAVRASQPKNVRGNQ